MRLPSWLSVLLLTTSACSKVTDVCECDYSGVAIVATNANVSSIQLSGPACIDAQFDQSRGPFRPGDTIYTYLVQRAGTCDVAVTFADGSVYTQSVEIHDNGDSDCCTRFHAWEDVRVPAGAGSPDAGDHDATNTDASND